MSELFTKYERARILGARALQISMDAPILIKLDEGKLDALNYDPLRIAEEELDSEILPISVNRPLPIRAESKLKKVKKEENALDVKQSSDKEENIVEELEEGLDNDVEEAEEDSSVSESAE